MIAEVVIAGRALVAGTCQASPVLFSRIGLSFWGGVDARTGRVVDWRHPLRGKIVSGSVLCLASGVGSCTGSQVLLELMLNACAPAAIVVRHADEIISLASIVGEELFAKSMPVVAVEDDDAFDRLETASCLAIRFNGSLLLEPASDEVDETLPAAPLAEVELPASDAKILAGDQGRARATALRIVRRVAAVAGAKSLIDVSRAHIDSCVYVGPASLRFAQALVELGGEFKVPTTTNAASVDLERWRQLGVPPELGEPASDLARAYLQLGAQPTFTCAPYLLESPPRQGEHVGWSESNAVAFANSCLGARTAKNADFLDACIALTGRAPFIGPHLDRAPTRVIRVVSPPTYADDLDAYWPILGYCVGKAAPNHVPLVRGLRQVPATTDDLKNFAAAFATTSAAPLFHLDGHTPEADEYCDTLPHEGAAEIDASTLASAWASFNDVNDNDSGVDLVAIGSPHVSVEEVARLAALVAGKSKHRDVRLIVTLAGAVLDRANDKGFVAPLRAFGAEFVTDTCWCMLASPVVPQRARILTNSAKYAHYAGGLVKPRSAKFAGLDACVRAAITARSPTARPPAWLESRARVVTSAVPPPARSPASICLSSASALAVVAIASALGASAF